MSVQAPRKIRVDARRNVDALLEAAKTVFGDAGVDAPAKQIADLAGVGVGTVYRHFPRRADLIKAVFQREVDACADAASELGADRPPAAALASWLDRYTELIATKRGLAAALHSDDPAFDDLADYFMTALTPAVSRLLDTAVASGEVRADVSAEDLMRAVANLCRPVDVTGMQYTRRMVGVLVDGLRAGHQH